MLGLQLFTMYNKNDFEERSELMDIIKMWKGEMQGECKWFTERERIKLIGKQAGNLNVMYTNMKLFV